MDSNESPQETVDMESATVEQPENESQETNSDKQGAIRWFLSDAIHMFNTRRWLISKSTEHFMSVGLLFVVAVSLVYPYPGKKVKEWHVKGYGVVDTVNVASLFFICGMNIKTEETWRALEAYPGLIYGVIVIIFVTPCLGFGILELPLSPNEFTIGLTIFAAMPTMLGSGVTLGVQVDCNETLALMLTVVSNLIGILSVPFAVQRILSSGADVELDAVPLLIKLATQLLVPLAVGKLAMESIKTVRNFVNERKAVLTAVSGLNLMTYVWQNVSSARDNVLNQNALDVVIILSVSLAFHLGLLLFNFIAAVLLRLDNCAKKAVVLACSEKTLPVAITVISCLNADEVGDLGLVAVPCILAHLIQLFIDAFIASRWASQHQKREGNEAQV